MDGAWWRRKEDLDDRQREFVMLPPAGRLLLKGPPGSGKTNLLLLRALYIAGAGEKNVLIITFTRTLADFIRTGIESEGIITSDKVRTFHSWAAEHIREYTGERLVPDGADFDDATRVRALTLLKAANKNLPTRNLYSAIFVDEAQDFSADELECLLELSEIVCVCGDVQQGIYERDGLSISRRLNLDVYELAQHYRISQKIARIADRIMPPTNERLSLEATSNYDERISGIATAKMHLCDSRDEQFSVMCELLDVQLDAFKGESIGILAKKESISELVDRFAGTKFESMLCVHGKEGGSFRDDRPIHLLTVNGAKGAEFRAVHIFGAEDFRQFPLNRRKISYTAVTRAKTALNVYCTGRTNGPLENAFAEPAHVEWDDLFGKGR